MNSEDYQERFYDTMLELANQLKINAETIQNQNIMSIINLILEAYNKKNIIFVYGAGRSGFIGRCFAQRLMHLNTWAWRQPKFFLHRLPFRQFYLRATQCHQLTEHQTEPYPRLYQCH